MRRLVAYFVIGLSVLLGGGSLVAFAVFLYAGSFGLKFPGLSHSGTLCLDAGLSMLFFVQHSGMVRRPFRQRLARFVPEEFDAAVYAIASGVALAVPLVFWQEGTPVLTAPGIFRLLFRILFWLSLFGFMWGGLSLKSFDPLGVRPVLAYLRGIKPSNMPFTARGAYLVVRHPLYLFSILMIWSSPDLTTDRRLFNIIWTVWIVVGARLEERDLITEFGDTYREYQRKVPMFIPRRIR
ncbi:MAG TPA: hypothetical protein VFG19_08455 [Geobacteraceae bacterium]|nr:hypothetical protein [Geobacteraceae bacterium]